MNKLFITLGSIAICGFSPLTTIYTIHNNELTTNQNKEAKYTGYLPFNASAFDSSASNQGGYFAYYKHSAFSNPWGDHWDYGYVAQLSLSSMPYLMASYNAAVQEHEGGAISAMSTYITAADGPKGFAAQTPYTSGWSLNSDFLNCAIFNEIIATNESISFGDVSTILNLVKSANLNQQTLTFFYFTAYEDSLH